jgi:hypothetical protein
MVPMTSASDPEVNRLDETWSELREGIESSRQIVRQSRVLLELCESTGPFPANDDEVPIAN